MAKQTLPVNYKNDVMASSMGAKRKWQITQNTDGTYNIDDVTTYDQVGSEFGAGDINATNKAVNESADAGKIIDDPDTAGATTEEGYIAGVQLFNHVNSSLGGVQFGIDGEGNRCYLGADGSLVPFSQGFSIYYLHTYSSATYYGIYVNSYDNLSSVNANYNLYELSDDKFDINILSHTLTVTGKNDFKYQDKSGVMHNYSAGQSVVVNTLHNNLPVIFMCK